MGLAEKWRDLVIYHVSIDDWRKLCLAKFIFRACQKCSKTYFQRNFQRKQTKKMHHSIPFFQWVFKAFFTKQERDWFWRVFFICCFPFSFSPVSSLKNRVIGFFYQNKYFPWKFASGHQSYTYTYNKCNLSDSTLADSVLLTVCIMRWGLKSDIHLKLW